MQRIIIRDLSDISRAAAEFAAVSGIRSGENRLFAFYGGMGAGKTTFITALCGVLGVKDVVNSPTFTIVNEYRTSGGTPVYHFDFYRIEKREEVLDIGFEEYVGDDAAICLMEWPEKIDGLLPEETVDVHISELTDGSREILFSTRR